MNLSNLPVNLFDCAFVTLLAVGLMRGRKHGMSEELLSLLKWLSVVLICSQAYRPIGEFFLHSSNVFSALSCYIFGYLTAALLVLAAFAGIKRLLGGKLLGSDIFGRAEYYLGMGSGLVRFGCVAIAALAILNARQYDQREVRAMRAYQDKEFGSNYFPTLQSVQSTVFETSLTGPWIRGNLAFLLIQPTRPEQKQLTRKEFGFPD